MSDDFGFRLTVQNAQLKCDTTGCSYVESIETPTEADIGRACPLCGACLLTAEDFKAAQEALLTIDAINKAFAPSEGTQMKSGPVVSINPHAGDIHITIKRR